MYNDFTLKLAVYRGKVINEKIFTVGSFVYF